MLSVVDLMILEQLEKENEAEGSCVSGSPEEEEELDGSRFFPAPTNNETLGSHRAGVPPIKGR